MSALRAVLILALLGAAPAFRLRKPQPAKVVTNATHTNSTNATHTNSTSLTTGSKVNGTVSAVAKKPLTADEQIAHLQQGLESIQKLRGIFTSSDDSSDPKSNLEEFAQGAMTTELSKKDSKVWSTIATMLSSTQQVMSKMKGKSKADQEKMMDSLEGDMNKQAASLDTIREKADVLQEQRSEEYLLGVLMQHQQWPMERQLNATKQFASNCAAARDLLTHYNATQPLAPQLASLMDARKAKAAGKVAAEKAAAKMFIQLASSLRVGRQQPADDNVQEKLAALGPVLDKLRGLDPKTFGVLNGMMNQVGGSKGSSFIQFVRDEPENVQQKMEALGPILDKLKGLDPKAFGALSSTLQSSAKGGSSLMQVHDAPESQEEMSQKLSALAPVLDKLRGLDPKAFSAMNGLIAQAEKH